MADNAMLQGRFERWMRLVGEAGFDGWLIADFRWNNPLFSRLLGLRSGILSRRAFLWLPAYGHGAPRVVLSQVDGHTVAALDCTISHYGGYEQLAALLRDLLPAGGRVAMEYVERGVLPTISRVDAGLLEMVRDCGVTVVSSGSLIAALEVWDERQQQLHLRAAQGVDAARRAALEWCAQRLRQGDELREGMVAELIVSFLSNEGLNPDHGPDVAVNAHAADPHYSTGGGEGAVIDKDAVLLIDLFAQVRDATDAPFADSTWMAYTGTTPPADLVQAFAVVRDARDAAIAAIDGACRAGRVLSGRAADVAARAVVAAAGLQGHLLHRTGHSLGADHIHGMGTNLDAVEFPDDRPLLPYSGFTVEPGLYWPGRFGVRLEISAILQPEGLRATTEVQRELTLLSAG